MYTQVILDSYIKFTPLVWRENNFQTFYFRNCRVPAVIIFIVLLVVAGFHRVLRRKL